MAYLQDKYSKISKYNTYKPTLILRYNLQVYEPQNNIH